MKELHISLYEFILKRPRFYQYSAIIIVATILTSSILHYKIIFSDINIVLTLFATIVQGFLGLIGFLGAIVLFKLQTLENNLNQTLFQLKTDLLYFISVIISQIRLIDTKRLINKIGYIESALFEDIRKAVKDLL